MPPPGTGPFETICLKPQLHNRLAVEKTISLPLVAFGEVTSYVSLVSEEYEPPPGIVDNQPILDGFVVIIIKRIVCCSIL